MEQTERRKTSVQIASEPDILSARRTGRLIAQQIGMSGVDQTLIATVVSELSRNILWYASPGMLTISAIENNGKSGIKLVARDDGPGIPDVEAALRVGFSTSGGLGLGLPGVRRLADEFEILSKVGMGTTVMVKKWKR